MSLDDYHIDLQMDAIMSLDNYHLDLQMNAIMSLDDYHIDLQMNAMYTTRNEFKDNSIVYIVTVVKRTGSTLCEL